MAIRIFFLALFIYISILPIAASAFSCRWGFVDFGASMDEVLGKCGEPIETSQHWEMRRQNGTWQGPSGRIYPANNYYGVQVDEWLFDFGAAKGLYLLTFEDGRLAAVQPMKRIRR